MEKFTISLFDFDWTNNKTQKHEFKMEWNSKFLPIHQLSDFPIFSIYLVAALRQNDGTSREVLASFLLNNRPFLSFLKYGSLLLAAVDWPIYIYIPV